MSRKKISPNNQPKPTKNARRSSKSRGVSLPFRYRLLMIACALCLILGFFFAARQHFTSMAYSMKNSTLRKVSQELESDKRRLLLTKEMALSPTEIKKAAQKIGFKAMNASNEFLRPVTGKIEKLRTEKSDAAKPKQPIADKPVESVKAEKSAAKKVSGEKPAETKIKKENTQAAK